MICRSHFARPGLFSCRIHAVPPGRQYEEGSKTIAEAAALEGATQLIHVSALGASPAARAASLRAKAKGEEAVRSVFPAATILRPGMLAGREDRFFNKWGAWAAGAPRGALATVDAGDALVQPVHVGDVAQAVFNILQAGPFVSTLPWRASVLLLTLFSLSVSLCVFLSIAIAIAVSLSLSLSVYPFWFICVYLSLSSLSSLPSLYSIFSISVSLSVCLSLSLSPSGAHGRMGGRTS